LTVKILMDNKDKWSPEYKTRIKGTKGLKKPLLVVAQKNHALDQFLKHILKFTNNIARIGSRSNDEIIKKFALFELRKLEKTSLKHFREMRESSEELAEIKDFLFQLSPLKYRHFLTISHLNIRKPAKMN